MLGYDRNLLGIGSDHIRVILTSCSELIGICSEKFRAISKIGSDFTDAAFRADMRVSEQNRSEPLGNASFRSETVGESKDLNVGGTFDFGSVSINFLLWFCATFPWCHDDVGVRKKTLTPSRKALLLNNKF